MGDPRNQDIAERLEQLAAFLRGAAAGISWVAFDAADDRHGTTTHMVELAGDNGERLTKLSELVESSLVEIMSITAYAFPDGHLVVEARGATSDGQSIRAVAQVDPPHAAQALVMLGLAEQPGDVAPISLTIDRLQDLAGADLTPTPRAPEVTDAPVPTEQAPAEQPPGVDPAQGTDPVFTPEGPAAPPATEPSAGEATPAEPGPAPEQPVPARDPNADEIAALEAKLAELRGQPVPSATEEQAAPRPADAGDGSQPPAGQPAVETVPATSGLVTDAGPDQGSAGNVAPGQGAGSAGSAPDDAGGSADATAGQPSDQGAPAAAPATTPEETGGSPLG